MRRAVLAIWLCAAPLAGAPAHAGQPLVERQALREAMRSHARAAGLGIVPLALSEPGAGGASATAARAPAGIGRRPGPQRLLIGVRAHADLRGVARALDRLGAATEAFKPFGVVAAAAPSGAELARALKDDPRIAYVERDRRRRIAADPFDAPDPDNGGTKFTWFFDDVRAGDALAAAGGGSRRTVAVLDTGLDTTHPEFSGRVRGAYDTRTHRAEVTDIVGHGTFVTGLVAAIDGNGIGAKGVAGDTQVLAIRASRDGTFTGRDLLRGIAFALRRGADVLNMSLAGDSLDRSVARALATAFYNDVLPVAASGNSGRRGNRAQFPAALLGGRRGAPGIGLAVGATRPDGSPAGFSTHNSFVSVAAPGAGAGDCRFGVLSTLPATAGTDWDQPGACSRVFTQGAARFAYGQGTSFAAPIVSGIASLTWQVERRLASEQVADVMIRSARQTLGSGWNEFTGTGVVDGRAAAALARRYDVTAPRARGRARRRRQRVEVRLLATRDRTEPGRELAAGVRYGLLVSRDGGRSFKRLVSRRRRPFERTVGLRGRRPSLVIASACDANGNCGVKRLGRFRR